MDVDSSETVHNGASDAPEISNDEVLNELGQLLERIAEHPGNVRLLRRQVDLMVQLGPGMAAEAKDAVDVECDLAFLGESLWIKFLDARINALPEVTLEEFVDLIELFGKAEKEYLSVSILKRHVEFILRLAGIPAQDGSLYSELSGDEEVSAYLNDETVRDTLRDLSTSAVGLINQSHELWQLWMNWEQTVLGRSSGSAKQEQVDRICEMYNERLHVPQTTLDDTSSAYSTFLSAHCPDDYEARMVEVTKFSQVAKKKLAEKRYGKTRSDFEDQLLYYPDSTSQLATLASYLEWETDPMAKNPRNQHSPKQDGTLIRAVFERTLLAYGNMAATAEEASFLEEATAGEGQTQMVDTANAYKASEALIWVQFLEWLSDGGKDGELSEVCARAYKACPGSGELWSRQLDLLEEGNAIPDIETTVEKATQLIVANNQPVTALVDVFYAHAAILNRRYRSLEPSLDHPVLANLTDAIENVSTFYKAGDPSLRLEKFILGWAEAFAAELIPTVVSILEKPVKSRVSSYQMTILLASALARQDDVETARSTYHNAIKRSDLDWPEAVYEAFVMFENVYGTLETTIDARKRVEKEQQRVNRRRQKEAEKQAAAQPYVAAEVPQSAAAIDVTPAEPAAVAVEGVAVPVETSENAVAPATAAPAVEAEPHHHLKRDRENTTVLVTGLKRGTDDKRVTSFFENWGSVRECSILPGDDGDTDAAMVEFVSADTMPKVLEKERRNLDGHEIRVSMLWRSNLFVTNFARTTDDASLKKLFSQYGKVLGVRWPSRKYNDQRRFCYITMESPAAAQEALQLHNFKIDGGEFPLTVLISDPAAKKKRTDAESTKSSLFVGGLNSKTTENDVNNLFSKYGTITKVKLGWDNTKRVCKGFAFVEMSSEDEAKAALAASGEKYKGKVLKVEINDPNIANKKREARTDGAAGAREAAERRARQVRLYDLPPGTQEGLLQQELEKIVPVKRLEVHAATHDALVELESQHDAGLLLMRPEPLIYEGVTLRIVDATQHRPPPQAPAAAKAAAPVPQTSLGFQPRQRKTAKPLGKAYVPPKKAQATAAPTATPAGSGQDAFRQFMTATNEQRKSVLDEKKVPKETAEKAKAETEAGVTAESSSVAGQKHALDDGSEDGSEPKKAKQSDE